MKLFTFDQESAAIFRPEDVISFIPNCPKVIITCFAHNLIAYAKERYHGEVVTEFTSANGPMPLYRLQIGDRSIGLIMTAIGAPAAVGEYEELFAMGVEKILVFGTCGVLDRTLEDCSIIVPTAAVREEGCSYHYASTSDELPVNSNTLELMEKFLMREGVSYTKGKVWTTDAIYRETQAKITQRKQEGCICVDMECSAIAALASFRNKTIAQFFYSADCLDAEEWNKRSLANHERVDVKQRIVDLAIDMSLLL